jgi:hypothetical protein
MKRFATLFILGAAVAGGNSLYAQSGVSADLKGSQLGRFRGEPESSPVMAGHTDASAAVGDKQSRFRVSCLPASMVSSWALLPRRPLQA